MQLKVKAARISNIASQTKGHNFWLGMVTLNPKGLRAEGNKKI